MSEPACRDCGADLRSFEPHGPYCPANQFRRSDPKAVGGEADRIAALPPETRMMLVRLELVSEKGAGNLRDLLRDAMSLLRSQALEIQKSQAQRDDALTELSDTRRYWQAAKAELEALASSSLPTEIPEKNNA